MIGFIKKDLLMIKSNFKMLAILLIIYVALALEGQMDISFLLPFFSVIIMISTFSYDTYNNWDAYACTLKDGRKKCVKAKYLATLILILIVTCIITVLSTTITFIRLNQIEVKEITSNIVGVLFSTILLETIMYPAIYKFGVEKARIGIFASIMGIAIVGSILDKYLNTESLIHILSLNENITLVAIIVVALIMLYISYKTSQKIYAKKEF